MKDYILISVNCNEKFWRLSPDELSGYIKHFQFKTCCIFELWLIGYGEGLMIFYKMSHRTHYNYL